MLRTIRETKVGKATLRLVRTDEGFAGILLSSGGNARVDGKDPEEVWRQLHDNYVKQGSNFFGFDGARARFLRMFPEAFKSAVFSDKSANTN